MIELLQMASSVVLRRRISEMTQCPICLDVFETPTSLPCLHTFCLRCLQSTFAADLPGDVASCPVCRSEFRLPAAGLAALPKNFTLGGLVELCAVSTSMLPQTAETPSSVSESRSGVQSAVDKDGSLTAETATACNTADCRDDACCKRSPLKHQGDQQRSSTRSTEDVTTGCDVRPAGDDEMEFCFDCRVDVCRADQLHRGHRRRRLDDVTSECHRRVASQLARVTDALNATYVALLHVDQHRTDVLDRLHRNEALMRRECDGRDVDDVERRLNALSVEKDDALRQLVAHKERLEVDQTSLETFLQGSARRLTTATTTAGLLHLVKELKMEASALLGVHQARLDQSDVDEQHQTGIHGSSVCIAFDICAHS